MDIPVHDDAHVCDGMKSEKERMRDIGLFCKIEVGYDDDQPEVIVGIYADETQESVIQLGMFDILYCPYCGMKLARESDGM